MHDLLMGLCPVARNESVGRPDARYTCSILSSSSSILRACPYGWLPTLRWMCG